MTMKNACAAALGLLLLAAGPPGGPGDDGEAPWEEQLAELGYQLIHISTINVCNGLNLDAGQIRTLREMSLRVEKTGAAPPAPGGAFSKELEEVRRVYRELRGVLLRGEKVDEDLRTRVLHARATESRVLRESLTPPRPGHSKTSCARCHAAPGEGRGGPFPAWARTEMNTAHSIGLYEWKGLALVSALAPKVDAVLNEGQRAIFSDFACCLVPPSNLSDPVRVGQAAVPDWANDLLRKVRTIPAGTWPHYRNRIADFFAGLEDARRPGITEADKEATRARLKKVMDEARGLSEMDFELSRQELAGRLAAGPKGEDHRIKRAYFLLSPGSVEIYDELLRRLEHRAAAAPDPGVEAEQPSCTVPK